MSDQQEPATDERHMYAVGQIKGKAISPKTANRYATSWNRLTAFCEQNDVTAMPATEDTALAFCASRSHLSHGTLLVDLAAIDYYHREAGQPSPTETARLYRIALCRQVGRRGETTPVEPLDSELVAEALLGIRDADTKKLAWFRDARNRLVVGLGATHGRRAGDLTRIGTDGVIVDAPHIALFVPFQKTDQHGNGETIHLGHLGPAPSCDTGCLPCAIYVYAGAIKARWPGYDGPLFPARFTSAGPVGTMSTDAVAGVIKKLAAGTGKRVGSRSLRKHAATVANAAGLPALEIAAILGQRSVWCTGRYIDARDIELLPLRGDSTGTAAKGQETPRSAVNWDLVECRYTQATVDSGTATAVCSCDTDESPPAPCTR